MANFGHGTNCKTQIKINMRLDVTVLNSACVQRKHFGVSGLHCFCDVICMLAKNNINVVCRYIYHSRDFVPTGITDETVFVLTEAKSDTLGVPYFWSKEK